MPEHPEQDAQYLHALECALRLIGTFATVQSSIESVFTEHIKRSLSESVAPAVLKRFRRINDDDRRDLAMSMGEGMAHALTPETFKAAWHRVKSARDFLSHTSHIVPVWSRVHSEFEYIGMSDKGEHRKLLLSEVEARIVDCRQLWSWSHALASHVLPKPELRQQDRAALRTPPERP